MSLGEIERRGNKAYTTKRTHRRKNKSGKVKQARRNNGKERKSFHQRMFKTS